MSKQKWTVEIEVDDTWVADGFDLTTERMHDIMTRAMSFAYSEEIACKVIARPDDEVIATLQGYPTVAEWRHVSGRKAA